MGGLCAKLQYAGLRVVDPAGASSLPLFHIFVEPQVCAAACHVVLSNGIRYVHLGVAMVWALDATVTDEEGGNEVFVICAGWSGAVHRLLCHCESAPSALVP